MITAAFGAQYVIRPVFGEKPRIDEMFTTEPTAREHVPAGGAHAVEDAGLHDRDRVVPVLVRDLLRVRPDAADPGVVDEDVDPAEVPRHRGERRVHLLASRTSVGYARASTPSPASSLGRPLPDSARAPDGDRRALLRQRLGDAQAEAGTGAGDDRHPSVKHAHLELPSRGLDTEPADRTPRPIRSQDARVCLTDSCALRPLRSHGAERDAVHRKAAMASMPYSAR